ncbi:uncharacterized protein LOC108671131 [Hyalella azteca]|uniref:Uncharacterized protein LOC108671131 n=1 Tax=Hyalella azteca TaxID=294128 RepID=A0A979FGH7_HYAAZ|nr:uncharacterized protein LOC108671131 [Hyalella azteca]
MECSPTDATTAQNASGLNEDSTQSLTETTGAATNASKSDEKAMQSLIEAVKRRRRSSLFPAPPAAGAGSPAAKGGGGALPDRSTRRSIGGARREVLVVGEMGPYGLMGPLAAAWLATPQQ